MRNMAIGLLILAASQLGCTPETKTKSYMDLLETELMECLSKVTKSSNCFEKTLGERIRGDDKEMQQQLPKADQMIASFISQNGGAVFAYYPMKQIKGGAIYEERSYILETTANRYLAIDVSVFKRLGKFYVQGFNLSPSNERITALIK